MSTGLNSILKSNPELLCKQVRSTWSNSALLGDQRNSQDFTYLWWDKPLQWKDDQNPGIGELISRWSAKMGSLFNPGLVYRTKRKFCPLPMIFYGQIYIGVKRKHRSHTDSIYPQTYSMATIVSLFGEKGKLLLGSRMSSSLVSLSAAESGWG